MKHDLISKLFTRTNIVLIIFVILGFLYRAFLHLFITQNWIPADEIINWVTVKSLVETGHPIDLSYYPHGMHYLIYSIWWLTRFNPQTLCMMFNPIIGALTTIPFYLFVRQYVNQKDALLSTLLFSISIILGVWAFLMGI